MLRQQSNASATVRLRVSDGVVLIIVGSVSLAAGVANAACGSDGGESNGLAKLLECGGGIAAIVGLIWMIQFLIGFGDVSDLCTADNGEQYQDLETVKDVIVFYLILNLACCCCLVCLVGATMGVAMKGANP